jgi:hypothetical protein
LVYKGLR